MKNFKFLVSLLINILSVNGIPWNDHYPSESHQTAKTPIVLVVSNKLVNDPQTLINQLIRSSISHQLTNAQPHDGQLANDQLAIDNSVYMLGEAPVAKSNDFMERRAQRMHDDIYESVESQAIQSFAYPHEASLVDETSSGLDVGAASGSAGDGIVSGLNDGHDETASVDNDSLEQLKRIKSQITSRGNSGDKVGVDWGHLIRTHLKNKQLQQQFQSKQLPAINGAATFEDVFKKISSNIKLNNSDINFHIKKAQQDSGADVDQDGTEDVTDKIGSKFNETTESPENQDQINSKSTEDNKSHFNGRTDVLKGFKPISKLPGLRPHEWVPIEVSDERLKKDSNGKKRLNQHQHQHQHQDQQHQHQQHQHQQHQHQQHQHQQHQHHQHHQVNRFGFPLVKRINPFYMNRPVVAPDYSPDAGYDYPSADRFKYYNSQPSLSPVYHYEQPGIGTLDASEYMQIMHDANKPQHIEPPKEDKAMSMGIAGPPAAVVMKNEKGILNLQNIKEDMIHEHHPHHKLSCCDLTSLYSPEFHDPHVQVPHHEIAYHQPKVSHANHGCEFQPHFLPPPILPPPMSPYFRPKYTFVRKPFLWGRK